MVFVNSLLLWGILGGIGIATPIIIHLFNKFRPKKIEWGAMELLRRTMQSRSREVKYEDLLVMLLRCLALFLIALALLRPALTTDGGGIIGQERRGVVFVIDSSYSMGHGALKTRFDMAKERLLELAEEVPSGSPISFIQLGRMPRVLLRAAAYDPRQFERIIEELEVLPEPLRLDEGLDLAAELAEEIALPQRSVYIVTDGQGSDWEPLPPTTRTRLEALSELATVNVVPVTEAGGENVTIRSFEFASGALRVGASARYVAEVVNHGSDPVSGAVRLDLDGSPVDTRDVGPLDPGASDFVFFTVPFREPGDRRLQATWVDDDLAIDNARFQVAAVPDAVRVLCVDGTPNAVIERSETFFLAKALGLHRSGFGQGMEVRVAPFFDLEMELTGREDLVVLANVAAVSDAEQEKLRELLERGGNLLVALGDQVDPARLQASLGDLLPATLLESKASGAASSESLRLGQSGHPVVEELTRVADYVDEVAVNGLVTSKPTDGARVLLTTESGIPVLLEHQVGRGTVLLLTTSIDRAWTNLPVSPVYPILLHQLLGHLTASKRSSLAVGQELAIAVPIEEVGAEAVMSTPDEDRVVGTVGGDETIATIQFGELAKPGFYAIRLAEDVGVRHAAVNIEPQEGKISALGRNALAGVLADTGVLVEGAGDAVEEESNDTMAELWRLLLVLGLLCFIIQAWLSDKFTRRKQVAADPIKVGFGAGVVVQ
ncbi:MAG: BatA domain-containing protein [Planctomycetota bacterium]|nr:BatA domain-containing protein [Planctomycetota bacterium]